MSCLFFLAATSSALDTSSPTSARNCGVFPGCRPAAPGGNQARPPGTRQGAMRSRWQHGSRSARTHPGLCSSSHPQISRYLLLYTLYTERVHTRGVPAQAMAAASLNERLCTYNLHVMCLESHPVSYFQDSTTRQLVQEQFLQQDVLFSVLTQSQAAQEQPAAAGLYRQLALATGGVASASDVSHVAQHVAQRLLTSSRQTRCRRCTCRVAEDGSAYSRCRTAPCNED